MEKRIIYTSGILFAILAIQLQAMPLLPPALTPVGFDQRLGEQVPLDLVFSDETGKTVRLSQYFGKKPVILVLAYYQCPMLCTQVLNGLVQGLLAVPFTAGEEFTVLAVSFDPRETPALAAAKKKTYVERYGRPGAADAWHFLTGQAESIQRLTAAVGFRYGYDAKRDQFAHASGITILTPTGEISRYFYDIKYSSRDLRLGLVEAAENKIGSRVDQILLFCFHYDPTAGKYGAAILNIVRATSVLTVICLATFMTMMWRQERRNARGTLPGNVGVSTGDAQRLGLLVGSDASTSSALREAR